MRSFFQTQRPQDLSAGTEPAEVKPVEALPARAVATLHAHGLWRCHVVIPDCPGAPAAEFKDRQGIRHLFCRRHTRQACEAAGITEPAYPVAN